MQTLFIIVLAAGAMAQNNTLGDVQRYRDIPDQGQICRIGVQHRYVDLIGEQLLFYDFETGGVIGPLLVTDVASEEHDGIMSKRHIAADVDCPWLVHRHGLLFKVDDAKYNHSGDALVFDYSSTIISEIRSRMRSNHSVCGRGDPVDRCHWKIQSWVWASEK